MFINTKHMEPIGRTTNREKIRIKIFTNLKISKKQVE